MQTTYVLINLQAGVASNKKWHPAVFILTIGLNPLAARDALATTLEFRTVELLLDYKLQTCQKGAECEG